MRDCGRARSTFHLDRHCERWPVARMSEATCGTAADPHVASLMRATITKHNSAFSRRHSPEFCKFIRPKKKRAQGRPGARCTRGLVCKSSKQIRTRAYRFSGNTPAFPAQWLYSLYRALPGETKACLSPSPPKKRELPRNLTPAIGASGPHDFAVRLTRCSSKAHRRPSLPAPTSVTMANAPSLGTGYEY
jgi:hypothetical protein